MVKPAPAHVIAPLNFTAIDMTRLAAAVRVACSISAGYILLCLVSADQRPAWLPAATVVLSLFVLYAVVLFVRSARAVEAHEPGFACWADSLWYLAFTAVTGGPDSHFWLLVPFPVFFVSLRAGLAAGLAMGAVSTAVLFLVGALTVGANEAITGVEVLLPPIALMVLGCATAFWANSGSRLSRQLAVLGEIDRLFTPRLDVEQLVDRVARQLARLYGIDSYALVLAAPGRPIRLFRAALPDGDVRNSERTAVAFSKALLTFGVTDVAIHDASVGSRERTVTDPAEGTSGVTRDAAAIAAQLECAGFCAIDFDLRQAGTARLFLCSNKRPFAAADLRFFRQLRQQLTPRIENLQLLDRLARETIEEERRKISRDIHDSAIQPYIGLKFALEALQRRVRSEDPLSGDIGRIVEMANLEISELRRFVKGLRGQGKPESASLIPVVRRQAKRFGDLYGIRVSVEAKGDFGINEGLAAEIFHIVSEALSNIRRHTNAAIAQIKLFCDMQKLVVQIVNPSDGTLSAKTFAPRSIAERACALGGACQVQITPDLGTVVGVEIPLRQ